MPTDVDQTDIASKVYDVVESLVTASTIDAACEYEYLSTEGDDLPCFGVYTLAGDPVEKEYLDGTYLANYRFMIILRQPGDDTDSRLFAVAVLRELSDVFANAPLDFGDTYTIWKKERQSLPARLSVTESYVDYQVTLRIQYKAHR